MKIDVDRYDDVVLEGAKVLLVNPALCVIQIDIVTPVPSFSETDANRSTTTLVTNLKAGPSSVATKNFPLCQRPALHHVAIGRGSVRKNTPKRVPRPLLLFLTDIMGTDRCWSKLHARLSSPVLVEQTSIHATV
jgi:hypothetical protein